MVKLLERILLLMGWAESHSFKKWRRRQMAALNKEMQLLQLLVNRAESSSLDWCCVDFHESANDDGAWKCPERDYIKLIKSSPAGEKFAAVIDYQADNQAETFLYNLKDFAENFDVDEHVEMWLPKRGKNGCPTSISVLVEDAQAIKNMLLQLHKALEAYYICSIHPGHQ